MDAIHALPSRASPPRLTEPGASPEQLEIILKAGARAPDHARLQPFRFLIVEGEARARLGALMAESLLRREPAAPEAQLAAERAKPLRAPTLIVVTAQIQPSPKAPDIEQVVAAGAAAENMLIAAHALGLGGFWRTGASAYDPAVKVALGFAPTDAIVGFLYFGTPTAPAPERPVDVAALTRRF